MDKLKFWKKNHHKATGSNFEEVNVEGDDTMKRGAGLEELEKAETRGLGLGLKKKQRESAGSLSSSSDDEDDDLEDSDLGDMDDLVDIEDDESLFVDKDKEREELVRSKFDILCQVPFFAQFKKEHQVQLFDELQVEHYKDGDLIVKQGDQGDRMYIMIEGEAVVWREKDGKSIDVTHLYQHDYFGELSLVYGQVRNSNVSSIGKTTVMYLTKNHFEKFETIRVYMIVQKIPLLSRLRPDMQVKIVRKLHPVRFDKGEFVVRQGEKGDAFFMIARGSAAVVENDEVSTNLYEGHTFGQMALLSGAPRLASVRAEEPLICMKLKAQDFQELIAENADFNQLLTTDDQTIRRRRSKRDARKKGAQGRVGTRGAASSSFDSTHNGRRFSTESTFSLNTNNSSAALIDTKVAKTSKGGHRVINGFVLGREIGRGTFGKVKLCVQENTGKKFAIKIVDKSKIENKLNSKHAPGLDEMRQEVAIMKKLQHPNIVNLIAVIDDPAADHLYIVTEYCEHGAIMSDLEDNEPLTEAQARMYFRDLLLGLQYLHLCGVIHRDIKPMNLLLTKENVVKIADFGAARIITGDTKWISGVTGTPAFMAPELLVEDAHVYDGPAVDLWSCGATLFMFVTGRPPWMSDDEIKLAKKVKNDELLFPDDWNKRNYSPHLKNLITQLLNKNPGQRPTLRSVMMHEWVTEEGSDLLPFIESVEGKVLQRWESSAQSNGPATTAATATNKEDLDAAIEHLRSNSEPNMATSPPRSANSGPRDFDELDVDAVVVESDYNSDDEMEYNENISDDFGRTNYNSKKNQKSVAGGGSNRLRDFNERDEMGLADHTDDEIDMITDPVECKKGGKKIAWANMRYSIVQEQNKRPTQEDTYVVNEKLLNTGSSKKKWFSSLKPHTTSDTVEDVMFAAVYDGHGGDLVSKVLKDQLHEVITSQPDFPDNLEKAVRSGCLEMDRNMLHRAANYIQSHRQKVSEGTARHSLMRTKGGGVNQNSIQEYQKAGSTALLFLASKQKNSNAKSFTVGWVGDSRAILSRRGTAIQLSWDHKASREDETQRVRDGGGTVRNNKVDDILAITRSFGDVMHKGFELDQLVKLKPSGRSPDDDEKLKNGAVIAYPDVITQPIDDNDEFVVLASDGLWDVLSNQAVVNLVKKELKQHQNLDKAAQALMTKAMEDSVDNISIIIMMLNQ